VGIGAACVALALGTPAAAGTAAEGPACVAVEGLEAVLARPGLRYLLVGEIHGTAEAPALFADMACAAAATGRPLVVAVEWPASSQAALDAFLAAEDEPEARAALMAAPAWDRPDGRSSEAMRALLEQVRALRLAGRAVSLVAFDHEIPTPGTSDAREAAMAARLREAAGARPEALVAALTGWGHADQEGFVSLQPPVRSMVQHLPRAELASVFITRPGGEAWMSSRVGEAQVWGPAALTAREPLTPRGVGGERPGFDVVVSTGRLFTASPPGREQPAVH
jgi:hypothetical protein